MTIRKFVIRAVIVLLAMFNIGRLTAEEIWLFDDTYLYGFIIEVTAKNELKVQLVTNEVRLVPLEDIVAISFRGRTALLTQTGTQEFRFLSGGAIRAEVLGNDGNCVRMQNRAMGSVSIGLEHFKGVVSLPMEGSAGRKANEMVESSNFGYSSHLDWILQKNGSPLPGVLRSLERTRLILDHEDFLMPVKVENVDLAGVRLADAGRKQTDSIKPGVMVRAWSRDGSVLLGTLMAVKLGTWSLRPIWDPERTLQLDGDELVQIQILFGRVQYLSQIEPVKVEEATLLSPPQHYRKDASCQGDRLSIAGRTYPWGLGVHANATLTYKIQKRFNLFKAAIGIATGMNGRGSVVFQVLGDGKELYKSPLIKGSEKAPHEISVPVEGVEELTLKVTDGEDLDLGDVANWAAARLTR